MQDTENEFLNDLFEAKLSYGSHKRFLNQGISGMFFYATYWMSKEHGDR